MPQLPRPLKLVLGACLIVYAGYSGSAAAEVTQLLVPDADFERCRTIADVKARLNCYEQATSKRRDRPQPSIAGSWRLVRTPNPAGGTDAISIMQIADPSRSDLDLAGLMVRCGEATTEVLIILVRPFPPNSPHQVTIASGSQQAR